MQQRYYDPLAGRFLSVDPARSAFNRYAYANNNPYRFTDPSGRYACAKGMSASDCGKVDAYVNKANESLNGLDRNSSDYSSLKKITTLLGKNDGKGVTIGIGPMKEGTMGQPTGLHGLQLDTKQTGGILAGRIRGRNSGMSSSEAEIAAGATTVLHETQHLIDANRPGYRSLTPTPEGFPRTKTGELSTERRAYGIEGAFGRGLQIDVGFSTPAEVEAGAQDSTATWCEGNPACN